MEIPTREVLEDTLPVTLPVIKRAVHSVESCGELIQPLLRWAHLGSSAMDRQTDMSLTSLSHLSLLSLPTCQTTTASGPTPQPYLHNGHNWQQHLLWKGKSKYTAGNLLAGDAAGSTAGTSLHTGFSALLSLTGLLVCQYFLQLGAVDLNLTRNTECHLNSAKNLGDLEIGKMRYGIRSHLTMTCIMRLPHICHFKSKIPTSCEV